MLEELGEQSLKMHTGATKAKLMVQLLEGFASKFGVSLEQAIEAISKCPSSDLEELELYLRDAFAQE